MNPIDLDTLKPGRQMDYLVADRVLGKLVMDTKEEVQFLPPATVLTDEAWNAYVKDRTVGYGEDCTHPRELLERAVGTYSTRMRWSQDVIDRMLDLGYVCDLRMAVDTTYCRFIREEEKQPWIKGQTPPEAICRAALKVVMESGE